MSLRSDSRDLLYALLTACRPLTHTGLHSSTVCTAQECEQILQFSLRKQLSIVLRHDRFLLEHHFPQFLAQEEVKIPLRIHHL